MASIDFRTPGAGFDQPLDLWQACHERVLRMCTLLQRLQEHLRTRDVDGDAKVTAVSVLRYFDEAGNEGAGLAEPRFESVRAVVGLVWRALLLWLALLLLLTLASWLA
mgnify:CR=1 FL=1